MSQPPGVPDEPDGPAPVRVLLRGAHDLRAAAMLVGLLAIVVTLGLAGQGADEPRVATAEHPVATAEHVVTTAVPTVSDGRATRRDGRARCHDGRADRRADARSGTPDGRFCTRQRDLLGR